MGSHQSGLERLLRWGQTDGLRGQQRPPDNRGRVRVQEIADRKGDRERTADDAQKARKMERQRGRGRERGKERSRGRQRKKKLRFGDREGERVGGCGHTQGESQNDTEIARETETEGDMQQETKRQRRWYPLCPPQTPSPKSQGRGGASQALGESGGLSLEASNKPPAPERLDLICSLPDPAALVSGAPTLTQTLLDARRPRVQGPRPIPLGKGHR